MTFFLRTVGIIYDPLILIDDHSISSCYKACLFNMYLNNGENGSNIYGRSYIIDDCL